MRLIGRARLAPGYPRVRGTSSCLAKPSRWCTCMQLRKHNHGVPLAGGSQEGSATGLDRSLLVGACRDQRVHDHGVPHRSGGDVAADVLFQTEEEAQ